MKARVYFVALVDGATPREQAKAMGRLYDGAGVSSRMSRRDLVAIKVHVGEKGNRTHVRPELAREVVIRVKARQALPFLTETSTLYRGRRDNAVKHILLAQGHGFSIEKVGAPFIMADGLVGNTEREVWIHGELNRSVKVAGEIMASDTLLVISHVTGHTGTGLAACIKNLGMGLASRQGKVRQHSAVMPQVIPQRCQGCGKCHHWCLQEAIGQRNDVSYIIQDRCVGCGACIAVCRFGAIRYDFGKESAELQKSMAEHAYGVIKEKVGKCFFFNVLVDMTKECDCPGILQTKVMQDIGLLGSDDPVAVDMAALDLTRERAGTDLSRLSHPHLDPMVQLLHAERLGMGSTHYTLEKVG